MVEAGFYAILAIGMQGMLFVFIILFSQQERLHSICLQLHEIDFLNSKGTRRNTVVELCILRGIGIIGMLLFSS